MATVIEGLIGQRIEFRFIHTVCAQPGPQPDSIEQLADGADRVCVTRLLQTKRDSDASINAWFARGVEFHDERQTERVREPVVKSAKR